MTFGNWANFFIGAVFWIIFASFIKPDLYGTLNLWLSISTFFSTFGLFGMNYLILSFYPKTQANELVSQAFLISLVSALISTIPIILLGFIKKFTLFEIALVSFFEIMVVLATITFAIMIAKKQFVLFFYSITGLRLIRITVGIILFIINKDIKSIILGFIIGTIPLLYFLGKNIKSISFNLLEIKKYYKDILWLYLLAIVSSSVSYLDKIVVSLVVDNWSLGVYQFSFQIYQIMAIVPATLFIFILGEEKKSSLRSLIISITILITELVFIIPFTIFLLPRWFPNYVSSPLLILTFAVSAIPFAFFSYESGKQTRNQKYKIVVISYIVGFTLLSALLIVLGIYSNVKLFGISFFISNLVQYIILIVNNRKKEEKKTSVILDIFIYIRTLFRSQ